MVCHSPLTATTACKQSVGRSARVGAPLAAQTPPPARGPRRADSQLDSLIALRYKGDVRPGEFKRLRGRIGWTQQRAGDEFGVHQVTVARWETGVHRIPKAVAALLQRLAAESRKGVRRR